MAGKQFPLAVVISAIDRASGPISAIASRVNRFSETATVVGRAMTLGVTAPLVAAGTAATIQAMSAERAMFRLADATGAPREQLERLAAAARAIRGDFAPADPLDALTAMVKAGAGLEAANAALADTANLAVATETGLADAARLTMGVLRAYGQDLSHVAELTDVLTRANAASELGLAGVASELIALSPLARELGLDVRDVAASVIALGRVSAQPTAVLRKAMAALIAPTRAAATALDRLGIRRADLFDDTGRLRGLADLMRVFEERGATATDMLEVFGPRAGPGMAALLRVGHAELKRTADGLRVTGIAAAAARARLDSTQGSLWEMQDAFEDLGVTLARSGIMDGVKAVAVELGDMVKAMDDTDPRILRWVVRLAAIAAAAGPVIWTVGKLTAATTALAAGWGKVAAAATAAATALGVSTGAVAAAAAAAVAIPAAVIFEDEITAWIEKQPWAQAATRWAGRVMDNKVFQAAEWFATFGGAVDLTGRNRQPSPALAPIGPNEDALRRSRLRIPEGGLASAIAQPVAEVRVRFDNAPRGTRATVERSRGLDVGLDLGWAMSRD